MRYTLLLLTVCVIVLFSCCLYQQVSAALDTKFMIWNDENGAPVVLLEGGITKPIEAMWTCYAAYDDIEGVKNDIKNIIAAGKVPYIQSYCFGDNGLRGDFAKAVAFDDEMSKAIGNAVAFVNLDTEWDDGAVIDLMKSAEGIQCFKDRINAYRTNAPNTWLLSSPGLWSNDDTYTFFTEIDTLLDLRANIFHSVSDEPTCTLRADNTYWSNGESLSDALNVITVILEDKARMTSMWGSANKTMITGDAAVTACGWGEVGQAAIINKLVENLDCLYTMNWRGAPFRNSAPDDLAQRAMGIENEGQFVYTTGSSSKAAMKRGLEKAIEIMTSGPNCVNPPTISYSIECVSCNKYWAQLRISPTYEIKSVSINDGKTTIALTKESYGDWTGSVSIEQNTIVTITIEQASGSPYSKRIYWLNDDPVPNPSPSTSPQISSSPFPTPSLSVIVEESSNPPLPTLSLPNSESSLTLPSVAPSLSHVGYNSASDPTQQGSRAPSEGGESNEESNGTGINSSTDAGTSFSPKTSHQIWSLVVVVMVSIIASL